jgi:hypothetical protein
MGRLRKALRRKADWDPGDGMPGSEMYWDDVLTGTIPWETDEYVESLREASRVSRLTDEELEAARRRFYGHKVSRFRYADAMTPSAMALLLWFDGRYGSAPEPTVASHYFRFWAIGDFYRDHQERLIAEGLMVQPWLGHSLDTWMPNQSLLQALCVLPYDRRQDLERTRRSLEPKYDLERVVAVAKRWTAMPAGERAGVGDAMEILGMPLGITTRVFKVVREDVPAVLVQPVVHQRRGG